MDISLDTIDVWKIDCEFDPRRLFDALGSLLLPSDIIAVGAYTMDPPWVGKLGKIETHPLLEKVPYRSYFEFNRYEYPNGRAWNIFASTNHLRTLALMIEETYVEIGPIPFDHIVAFRPGLPLLPLLNFHDAFRDELYVTGHYDEEIVAGFCELLQTSFELVSNPERGCSDS